MCHYVNASEKPEVAYVSSRNHQEPYGTTTEFPVIPRAPLHHFQVLTGSYVTVPAMGSPVPVVVWGKGMLSSNWERQTYLWAFRGIWLAGDEEGMDFGLLSHGNPQFNHS